MEEAPPQNPTLETINPQAFAVNKTPKKLPLKLIGIVLSIILILAGGTYVLTAHSPFKNGPPPTIPSPTVIPSPSLTPEPSKDSSNWKTYENKNLGFMLKHPEDATVGQESDGKSHAAPPGVFIHFPAIDNFTILQVQIWDVRENLSTPEDLLNLHRAKSKSEIKKQDVNGVQFSVVESNDSENRSDFSTAAVHNDKIYLLTMRYIPSKKESIAPLFYQLLSTFKLTSIPFGWKPYAITKYGITFAYPPEWYPVDVTKDIPGKALMAIGLFKNGTKPDIGAEGHAGNEQLYFYIVENTGTQGIIKQTPEQFLYIQKYLKKELITVDGHPTSYEKNGKSYTVWYNETTTLSIYMKSPDETIDKFMQNVKISNNFNIPGRE